jgi:myo-inositol 2-dehydrogenase / D-chiro-inositol 1-dehydrogenase
MTPMAVVPEPQRNQEREPRNHRGMVHSPPTLNIGVSGLGQLAREVHLPLLASFPEVRVAAVADPDPEAFHRCQKLAPKAQYHSSLQHMLRESALDAVLVASPTAEHAGQGCQVLEAGKALYLEKPLATSVLDGMRFLNVGASSPCTAMMGFNYRFHPLAERLRKWLHRNPVKHGRSTFTLAPRPLPSWKEKRASGGGVLLDLASHHFDLLRFLLGSEVASVNARIWSERTEQDCCEIQLAFLNGISIQGFYSFCRTEQDAIELNGGNGKALLDRYAPLAYPLWPLHKFTAYQWERWRSPWKEVSFRRSLGFWIESIRRRSASPVTLRDGLESLRVVGAAETSALRGQVVSLNQQDRAAGGTP